MCGVSFTGKVLNVCLPHDRITILTLRFWTLQFWRIGLYHAGACTLHAGDFYCLGFLSLIDFPLKRLSGGSQKLFVEFVVFTHTQGAFVTRAGAPLASFRGCCSHESQWEPK